MWDTTKYDWDPTNDQPQLPNPCLDEDFNPSTTEDNPCRGKNIQISFTGSRVIDNNHGWKEIHPVRKEAWTDSTGSNCYSFNEADQSKPTTCTADTTAPTLSSVAPAVGATGVAPADDVTASFSEAMASTSLTSNQNFSLWYQENGSWNQVPASVTLSTDGKTATLNPSSDLKANTKYQANIWVGSEGVTDKAGNALSCTGAPFLSCYEDVWLYWDFTTR